MRPKRPLKCAFAAYLRGLDEEPVDQDLDSKFEGHETAIIHYLADAFSISGTLYLNFI